jgi:hypothetical protein
MVLINACSKGQSKFSYSSITTYRRPVMGREYLNG